MIHKKPLLELDALDRFLDLLEKLLGRRQYAVDGVDENQHEFAGEAIVERERRG